MLRLFVPSNASPERRYVADVLFRQFLGVDIEVCPNNREEVVITDGTKRRLILDDTFFGQAEHPLLRTQKIPALPLQKWSIPKSELDPVVANLDLPVLFGRPLSNESYLEFSGKEVRLGIDILGSAFFMLTRYEEVASTQRDEFDRFPAAASIAFQAGFLGRPLVNEYVEVLWQCLKRLWGGLTRRLRTFRVILSHDVDQPFLLRKRNFFQIARTIAGDALKRGQPLLALNRPAQWVASRFLGPQYDPAYTFNYIMDLSEKHGLRSAFYFIPSLSAGPPDYRYGIHDPEIRTLMSDIRDRGHEIGYHASINTYKDRELIHSELKLLREACARIGLQQAVSGSRQHYLRIQLPLTLRYLAEAQVGYDTSLSFADHAGFRCGTCWEYEFYDLESRKPLGIIERPLIVMECSVTDDQYMARGLGLEAQETMLRLAGLCRKFSGDFTLLWHNTRLASPPWRQLFERVVAGAMSL